jgi:hypothetical protein
MAGDVAIYNDYARFVLMKQKFRQRTGMCVLKFNPGILPGFVARVEDPLDAGGKPIATVFGYVNEVTHTLSCVSNVAQTSFSMSHIRYDGEVPDALRANPLYSGYDVEGAAEEILGDAIGNFNS